MGGGSWDSSGRGGGRALIQCSVPLDLHGPETGAPSQLIPEALGKIAANCLCIKRLCNTHGSGLEPGPMGVILILQVVALRLGPLKGGHKCRSDHHCNKGNANQKINHKSELLPRDGSFLRGPWQPDGRILRKSSNHISNVELRSLIRNSSLVELG